MPPTTSGYDPSTAMRWLLATLSFSAGAIHLAMVPQHAQEALEVGVAFAAAGWFQIVFGAVVLSRPTRAWVVVATAANVVFIAAWALSRSVGLPTWTGAGGVEPAAPVDMLCVGFELGIVVAAIGLLLVPNLLKDWKGPGLAVAAVVPVGILLATTAVLAAPSTAGHAHGGADAPHDQAAGDHHETGEGAGDHTAGDAEHAAGDHHQTGEEVTYDQLAPETKAEVDRVIEVWADRYPTAADAAGDGWFRATRSLYGIGAHFVQGAGFGGESEFDLLNPNILLYDGEGPDAPFAGVSYVLDGDPEGFTGDDDLWHGHSSACSHGGTVVSLSEEDSPVWLSESDCSAVGGMVVPIVGDQMMHLWIGPGYTDGPIFAHDNAELLDGFNPQQEL